MNLFSIDDTRQRCVKANPDSPFELCSDRMQRLFPEYDLDPQGIFLPRETAPRLNFNGLKEILCASTESKANWEAYEKLMAKIQEGNQCHFLDGQIDMTGNRVGLQSFVRSGNTFIRRYLEQVTGIVTGADMHIDHTFFEAMMGLLGQNITSDSNMVWITKTHWPQDIPGSKAFTAEKMIVIARNPLDVMPSFANLLNTHSHSLQVEQSYSKDEPDFWQAWVKQMTLNMKANHTDVLNIITGEIPTYFMRYEDLKLNPVPALTELFCFLFDVETLEGTFAELRIKQVTAQGFSTKTAYKLKDTSLNLNRNLGEYSPEQLAYIKDELTPMLQFWEYNVEPTAIFDLDDAQTKDEITFREFNRTRTLPLCGMMAELEGKFTFGKTQRLMTVPQRIPERVTIKHQ